MILAIIVDGMNPQKLRAFVVVQLVVVALQEWKLEAVEQLVIVLPIPVR